MVRVNLFSPKLVLSHVAYRRAFLHSRTTILSSVRRTSPRARNGSTNVKTPKAKSAKSAARIQSSRGLPDLIPERQLPQTPVLGGSAAARNQQKNDLAQKLLENGHTWIYTAPRQTGFLLATYVAGTTCGVGVVMMYLNELWKTNTNLPLWVGVSNRLVWSQI